MNKQLYVVTSVFNPFNFASRDRLYRAFKAEMEAAGVKVFTVEAAFNNQPFAVTTADDPYALQVRTNQILWHKERLMNKGFVALKGLVPDCQFIGMFDSDITFLNPDWVADTIHQLGHVQVVQPFSQAASLNADDEVLWTCPGTIAEFIEKRGYHQVPPLPVSYVFKGHPGLAWAYQRQTLDRLSGLYDKCIAGSADTVMANCFKGDWTAYLPGKPTEAMKGSMQEYATRVNKVVRGSIGYAPGCVLHHWHGKSEDRGYEKRWSILSFHGFDPERDIILDPDSMWRWAGNKPQLEEDIRLSLSKRNEDAG